MLHNFCIFTIKEELIITHDLKKIQILTSTIQDGNGGDGDGDGSGNGGARMA